jgi:hypothetical protein
MQEILSAFVRLGYISSVSVGTLIMSLHINRLPFGEAG